MSNFDAKNVPLISELTLVHQENTSIRQINQDFQERTTPDTIRLTESWNYCG